MNFDELEPEVADKKQRGGRLWLFVLFAVATAVPVLLGLNALVLKLQRSSIEAAVPELAALVAVALVGLLALRRRNAREKLAVLYLGYFTVGLLGLAAPLIVYSFIFLLLLLCALAFRGAARLRQRP